MSHNEENAFFHDLNELQGLKRAYLTKFKQVAIAFLIYKLKRIY
jgi:hypothetical protein